MRFSVLTAVVLAASLATRTPAHAQPQAGRFPYRAVVVADEVLVRSGGGENFYGTQRLKRDAIVTVRRHDPGGWYLIEPPEGSFSWVPDRYVERHNDGTGLITENHVVAFVGSEFGDECSVWQRKLALGEKVHVLGKHQLDTPAGFRRMCRIAPPVREWRWIPGSAVVPHNLGLREQHDRDPWKTPSTVRRSPAPSAGTISEPGPRLTRLRAIRREQERLTEIDRRFHEMVRLPPSAWDLGALEADYFDLQQSATHPPVAGQIDLRYPAIQRYRARRVAWDDLKRVMSETERRDAELVASQYGSRESHAELPGENIATTRSFEADHGGELTVGPGSTPLSAEILPPVSARGIPPNSRYIGAGIVSRSETGEFVLTSPAGSILARFGETAEVDLNEFVGRPVGLHGTRWYREDLSSDYIEISGLEPVRLRR